MDRNEMITVIQKYIDAAVEEGLLPEGKKAMTLRGFVFQFVLNEMKKEIDKNGESNSDTGR